MCENPKYLLNPSLVANLMFDKLLAKVFGSRNQRVLRSYEKTVKTIHALEVEMQALSNEALAAKTTQFRDRLAKGEKLDDLLPEAFAVVREAAVRTLGLRHYDVQLLCAMALNTNKIAEMRTGEGKTLSSTLAIYLNALSGKGVHVVTVNDYLAERDANWMRPIYEFLGLSVGINLANMSHEAKQEAYRCDITYGTNNEFGFDYLRDNMAQNQYALVQRPLHYAIIDEVDSILIDEARTPLIISGQVEDSVDHYQIVNGLVPKLRAQLIEEDPTEETVIAEHDKGDYYVDEKNKNVTLTEQGHATVEDLMLEAGLLAPGSSLYDASNIRLLHYLNAALKAHALFKRDVDYIVRNNEVIIIDEHTGRLMQGRRWSDGLHQAVEVKEGVPAQMENQTLATITFQNYFRLYEKLAGMTGTADTEAYELQRIYGLEVLVIPTNKPMIREDRTDQIFLTNQDKYQAIIRDILECQKRHQPILVGTASVESSELVSAALKKANIKHEVLNAKNHLREAMIIAQAGKPDAVTIATNMAGRGTDIVLGGNVKAAIEELSNPDQSQIDALQAEWQKDHATVIAAGGLYVLGTERNESRRVDNQLRGRSGRQGDPGRSQFYLSMDDSLLRIFAGEKMRALLARLGLKDGEMISHKWLNSSIESAQRKVEGLNFDMRKQLLEYDDVANDQRKVIYKQRRELMDSADISQVITKMRQSAVDTILHQHMPEGTLEEQWDIAMLERQLKEDFMIDLRIADLSKEDQSIDPEVVRAAISEALNKRFTDQEALFSQNASMREIEKSVTLQIIDQHWREHLASMDHLRMAIQWRGIAQKNPAQEYKRESFDLFRDTLAQIKYKITSTLCCLHFQETPAPMVQPVQALQFAHEDAASLLKLQDNPAPEPAQQTDTPFKYEERKVGRNELCPCGSEKKYKQCHGKIS
jgi:preprotein translocase subunit SecA